MCDDYRWPSTKPPTLQDGLSTKDVIDALNAPETLRLENRVPAGGPTFMAVCAPTDELRLIVVLCTREDARGPWVITAARDARPEERAMWRKETS